MTSVALAQTNTIAPQPITTASSDLPRYLISTEEKMGIRQNILKYFLGFLGLLCVVMIIYGGFSITSAVKKAQKKERRLFCIASSVC